MAELIVRQAEAKDVRAIEAMEQVCFTDPWSYESLYHDIVENPVALYLVAEEDGQICGYVGLWKILDEGHITNVAVAPAHRRRHMGTALLTVLMEVGGANGILRYTLEVRKSNEAAHRLYAGLGFMDAGLRKGYYQDNGEDAIIMWKETETEGKEG